MLDSLKELFGEERTAKLQKLLPLYAQIIIPSEFGISLECKARIAATVLKPFIVSFLDTLIPGHDHDSRIYTVDPKRNPSDFLEDAAVDRDQRKTQLCFTRKSILLLWIHLLLSGSDALQISEKARKNLLDNVWRLGSLAY